MLIFEAEIFSDAFNAFARLEIMLGQPTNWLDAPEHRKFFMDKCRALIPRLKALGLKASWKKAEQIDSYFQTIDTFNTQAAVLVMRQAAESLRENIQFELDGRQFYAPNASYEKYYDQPKLFGDAVFNNFGSAAEDIYEAGMCLALERGTACVMHLMRVQELGLKVLASTLGVTMQNDWGSYLRKIQETLDTRTKASGKRSADEQFYAEAAASFDRLRLAYRNPSMHPEKSYSPERAEQILLAAKDFMNHLAPRLSEPPASTGPHA
jgi:hypothetical protein